MPDRLHTFAKALRREMTDAEQKLWMHLRAGRLAGHKFKRQQPLGSYIADFVCFEARLIVEVDGSQHLENQRDTVRDAWFERNDFRLLRFWNDQALKETEAVLETILRAVEKNPPSPLAPPPRGGRGTNQISASSPSPLAGEGLGRGGD